MAIETYLIEDSEKMVAEPEHLEDWLKTIEELGLEGQKTLTKEEKSPIPFPLLNTGMERVYKTLCPTKTEIKKYSHSTIPLRVLSLIALAEREKYFNRIEIWDDNEKPDPIAVGYINGSYSSPMHIIARWGDELKDFASLKKEAMARWKEQKTAKWRAEISELQAKLNNADSQCEQYFVSLEPEYKF